MKHPHYSKLISSRELFQQGFDEFSFDPAKYELPPPPLDDGSPPLYTVEASGKIKIQRQCYHMELDLAGTSVRYTSGDHVGIWAENDPIEVAAVSPNHFQVERLGKALGILQLDQLFVLAPNAANKSSSSAKMPFPTPCSYRTALLHYVDLRMPVKQHHFKILAKYSADSAEELKNLQKLSTDRALFVEYVDTPQKTLAEVLHEFPSIKLPPAVALGEILPRNTLRYYSISSSSVKEPNIVSITAVVVRYAIACPRLAGAAKSRIPIVVRQGLMTSHLERLHRARVGGVPRKKSVRQSRVPKFYIPMYIRTSSFKLPSDPTLPVVMVGPGTGAAPFRAFLWDRFTAAVKAGGSSSIGPTVFVYGCRNPEIDYLYASEIQSMQEPKDGAFDLTVWNAFSRVPGQKKVYVQNRMEEHGEVVWDLLHKRRGFFFICGDAKNMAVAVHEKLNEIAARVGNLGEQGGKDWVKELRSAGRYHEDTWA